MRFGNDIDTINDLQLTELDSHFGPVPILDQHDVPSAFQTLQDDLAELPQAFAAYLAYQQNQWS